MYEEKFKNILLENEEIVIAERPKKTTFILNRIISIIVTICVITGTFFYIKFLVSAISLDSTTNWTIYFMICITIIALLKIITYYKAYSNYYFCLTNKRIIIRYGTFTNNYNQYSIENVTGNIKTSCTQSIWDKKDGKDASGKVSASIELLPVGHGSIYISTRYSIENAYEMTKEIERVVKNNAKSIENVVKE